MAFTIQYDQVQHAVGYVTDGMSRLSTAKQASVLAQAASYIAGAPTAVQVLEDQVITIGRSSGRYPCLAGDGPAQVTALQAIVNT